VPGFKLSNNLLISTCNTPTNTTKRIGTKSWQKTVFFCRSWSVAFLYMRAEKGEGVRMGKSDEGEREGEEKRKK
jgi:hypothetical protein